MTAAGGFGLGFAIGAVATLLVCGCARSRADSRLVEDILHSLPGRDVTEPAGPRPGSGASLELLLPGRAPAATTAASAAPPSPSPAATTSDLGGVAVWRGDVLLADARSIRRLEDGQVDILCEIAWENPAEREPLALASSAGGVVYALAARSGAIFHVDPVTGRMVHVASGFDHPSAVLALANGSLAVVETGAGRVSRVDPGGNRSTLSGGLARPVGIAQRGGWFLVAEPAGGRILALREGAPPVLVATGLALPVGLAVDGSGRVHVAEAGTRSVVRLEADGTRTELVKDVELLRAAGGEPETVPMLFDGEQRLVLTLPGRGMVLRVVPP